jgi:uncharacterized SAM-binding protein YcdF (DUF218 family)
LRLASIFWFLFSTGGLVVTMIAAVAWLFARPKSRAPRQLLVALVCGYAIAGSYPVPHTVERWVSRPFHPLTRADVPAGRAIVVLLGSGSYRRFDWSDRKMSMLDPIGAERTLEAARVYRLIDPAFVISSGGLIDPDLPEDPSGDTMAETLIRLGVPADRVIIERQSTNTRDEALSIAAMLPALKVQHVVLVTSGVHMRRAVGMFRSAGVDVIPAVAREIEYSKSVINFVPSDVGLRRTALVVHELGGIAYYWLKGWYK